MKPAEKPFNILYCSSFRSHRAHRELVRLAASRPCKITALPWEKTSEGTYAGPGRVDGVISHLDPKRARSLQRTVGNVPHVTTHAGAMASLSIPGVILDHVSAGRLVAEHYLALGFSHFAAFVDDRSFTSFDGRFKGFSACVRQAGLTPPQKVALTRPAKSSYNEVLSLFANALKKMNMPLAIMAANDRAAIKVMDTSSYEGFSIPAQIAVCGFDNDPIDCELAPIPLSSVDTNLERQARESLLLLLSMLEGEDAPTEPTVIEPRGLVVRRSSGVKAQESIISARALAYIHQHVWDRNLSVPAIAEQIQVSLSTLFLVFSRELSTTPLKYITQLRIEKAQRLMTETSLKLNEIRPRCGFASDYQMYRAFRRTTGKGPGSFRKSPE